MSLSFFNHFMSLYQQLTPIVSEINDEIITHLNKNTSGIVMKFLDPYKFDVSASTDNESYRDFRHCIADKADSITSESIGKSVLTFILSNSELKFIFSFNEKVNVEYICEISKIEFITGISKLIISIDLPETYTVLSGINFNDFDLYNWSDNETEVNLLSVSSGFCMGFPDTNIYDIEKYEVKVLK